MPDHRLGFVDDLVTGIPDAMREIDVFKIGDEIFGETAAFEQHLPAVKPCRCRDTPDGAGLPIRGSGIPNAAVATLFGEAAIVVNIARAIDSRRKSRLAAMRFVRPVLLWLVFVLPLLALLNRHAARRRRMATAEIGRPASIAGLKRLSGGASQETWSFDAVGVSGTTPLILRRAPGGKRVERSSSAPTLEIEAKAIRLAAKAGVPVPPVPYVLEERDGLGPGYLMVSPSTRPIK